MFHIFKASSWTVTECLSPARKLRLRAVKEKMSEFETTTDDSGRFRFDHVSGKYLLHVERTEDAGASREVVVGEALMFLMRRNTIYVITGPGACTDDCSSVFASKSEFDRIIKRNNGHNY